MDQVWVIFSISGNFQVLFSLIFGVGNWGTGLCSVLLNEISLDGEDWKCENLVEHSYSFFCHWAIVQGSFCLVTWQRMRCLLLGPSFKLVLELKHFFILLIFVFKQVIVLNLCSGLFFF